MQAIFLDKATGTVQAASDPRGIGSAKLLEPTGSTSLSLGVGDASDAARARWFAEWAR
jgi:hypothetical protein